jgi:hypothetical protein
MCKMFKFTCQDAFFLLVRVATRTCEYTQRGEPSRLDLTNGPVLVELTGLNTIQLYLSMRAYLQEFKNWGVNHEMLRGACVAVVAFLKICTYVYPVL